MTATELRERVAFDQRAVTSDGLGNFDGDFFHEDFRTCMQSNRNPAGDFLPSAAE